MREKILQALRNQGFLYEEQDSGDVAFHKGIANIVCEFDKRNPQYFELVMYGLFEEGTYSKEDTFAIINEVNNRFKYVKAYMLDSFCNISYETQLSMDADVEHIEALICHMATIMEKVWYHTHDISRNYERISDGEDDEPDDDTEDTEEKGE